MNLYFKSISFHKHIFLGIRPPRVTYTSGVISRQVPRSSLVTSSPGNLSRERLAGTTFLWRR